VSDVEERLGKFVRLLATVENELKLNKDDGVHYKVISVKDSSSKKKIGRSIITTSETEKVDYLVVGSRSSSMTKTVLGSISQYVLKHSKVPVIVGTST
jgi:nucleotide-binding universal stress UspA family protein